MKEQYCTWCGTPANDYLCHDCYEKALGVPKLSAQELDDLPFGAIKLDAQGKVLFVNRAEEKLSRQKREQIIGKNFFADVAPCARVRAFRDRFSSFLRGSKLVKQFRFNYQFDTGPVRVHLVFVRAADEEALVIISKKLAEDSKDEAYIR